MSSQFKDKDLQILLGNILRWGVYISMSFVVFGLILYFFQNGNQPIDFDRPNIKFNFSQWWQQLLHFQGESWMALGVMCLIFTPILRVSCSLIGFQLEGDKRYTIVATIVLLIILMSILLGKI